MKEIARLVEAGLGGEDAVVDLATPARRAGEHAQPLELALVHRRLAAGVEHLDRRGAVVGGRNAVVTAEHDVRRVLLRLDLHLRAQAHAREVL